MHNQFPLFTSPLQAYLLEQAPLNYSLHHLVNCARDEERHRLAKDTWLVWSRVSLCISFLHPVLYTSPPSSPSPRSPTLSSLCDSPHPLLLSFPNISRASVASCDWCACDYEEIGSRARLWVGAQKYLENLQNVEEHRVSLGVAAREVRPDTDTETPAPCESTSPWFHPRGWRPNLWISSSSPPPPPACHIGSFSSLNSLLHVLLLLLLSYYFFPSCLASGPLELYLISFCWVN